MYLATSEREPWKFLSAGCDNVYYYPRCMYPGDVILRGICSSI
jgi:hypothetical protein